MLAFERFFKYIYLTIIHALAFGMMYHSNLEMVGYGVGIIASFITGGYLWRDIYLSPKINDPVLFSLLPSILGGLISLLIFATFLTTTHSKYNAKGSKILLTKESRGKLNHFRSLYVYGYIGIAMVSLIFFLLYKDDKNGYDTYFKLPQDGFVSLFFIVKVVLALGIVGITGRMLYVSNDLKKQNTKQLYIPPESNPDVPNKYPYKYKRRNMSMMDDIRGFFKNVNLDYIVNYNISRMDYL